MKQRQVKRADLLVHFWQQASQVIQVMIPGVPLKGACVFRPTCSEFARQAITRYGMIQGVWITLKRISRCHPYSRGGSDPVEKYL